MDNQIYRLGTFELAQGRWKLETYQEYWNFLEDKDLGELETLIHFVEEKKITKEFRWILEVLAVQYYVGVFPEQKLIRLASKNLNYELTIIDYYSKIKDEKILALKDFILSVGTIPLNNIPMFINYLSFKYDLPLFNQKKDLENLAIEKGLSDKLVLEVGEYKKSLFERFSDFGLTLTANYMLVRVHLLKYLAILPCLDHDKDGREVKRLFLETLRRFIEDNQKAKYKKLSGQKKALPVVYTILAQLTLFISNFLPPNILASMIRKAVGLMARRFIAGETMVDSQASLEKLISSGRDATLDQLGELVVSKKEADQYTEQVLALVEGFEAFIKKGERNSAGILKAHVSIKVSALCHDFNSIDFNYSFEQVAPRLRRILSKAQEKEVFINIDAEHYHYRDMVFKIYKEVLLEEDFKGFYDTGIVVQGYLKDAYGHLVDVIELAKERQGTMPIRLVKGAYWDAETIEADAHNFESPQFLNKEETDLHFRQLAKVILENSPFVQLAIASHNIKDHCFVEVIREQEFSKALPIEHQCLHMTYEALSVGLSKMGYATRNYIPIGDLLVGMAYLVRRIMENSSQVGVLTIMRSHKKNLGIKHSLELLEEKQKNGQYVYERGLSSASKHFKNVYPLRSYLDRHVQNMKDVVKRDLENIKNGKLFYSEGASKVVSNSDHSLLLGTYEKDTIESVAEKIQQLFNGYKNSVWKTKDIFRFSVLLKIADILIERREKFASLIILEAGKTLDEALADVDEAIDFLNFYIREQIAYEKEFEVESLGVIGVIAPWNFPLAIPVGMTVASLISGNTVILKPAEQTPLVAQKFIDLCHECGVPRDVLLIAQGEGDIGKSIVDNELVSGIVFTGSKNVGLQIYRKLQGKFTSTKYDFSPRPKLCITEMGGKNAIIVSNNCELDETISGILYSSFAHAGQKCSAASRIIIDREIKDAFIKRFVEAVKNIKVGAAYDFSTYINPVATTEDKDRIRSLAIKASEEVKAHGGIVHLDYTDREYVGDCIGPSIFEVSAETAIKENTMAKNEVFGPMVHIIPYENLNQAIEIFNSTEYALTGGIYCQSQDDIDYLVPKLDAGNIYINRPNTGARVAIEPFGGYKMSGTGPKAGSRDYLKAFNFHKNFICEELDLVYSSFEYMNDISIGPSRLGDEKRNLIVRRCLNKLIDEFEVFFKIVTEDEKSKLQKLKKAIKNKKFFLDTREFPNRYIPGQISFDRKNKSLGTGIVLDGNEKVSVELMLDVLVNLLVGNGLIIVAQTEDSFHQWAGIIGLLNQNGISEYNLKLCCLNEDKIIENISAFEADFIITTHELPEDLLNPLIERNKDRILKISYVGKHLTFDERLAYFTHSRSYAINTMRHGAPLDLIL